VCIFVCKDLNGNNIAISRKCEEKYLEICAVELETEAFELIILSLHRAPTRDFNRFVKNLEVNFKYLCKPKAEFLIFGDINTYYLIKKQKKTIILFINNI
jgi:hypothetical protein